MSKVTKPTKEQLKEYCKTFGLDFDDSDLDLVQTMVTDRLKLYDDLASLPDYQPRVEYARKGCWEPEDNEFNAWYVKCDIKGEKEGPLAGKTVAIKDNVCVAGVKMMNGSHTLEGYVPDVDATIVTRILRAGGTIAGKAHCEDLCCSGGSSSNFKCMTLNPNNKKYSAGGSSSGSGAIVASNQADLAIGGDQGGSIRIPSALCGIVGLKPTHGLVPYTGVFTIEYTLDHVGPMSKTVRENAEFLSVLAGSDTYDARQNFPPGMSFNYLDDLDKGVKGLKIGRLVEGFNIADDAESKIVNDKVNAALDVLESCGAEIIDISVPFHKHALGIWNAIITEGMVEQMVKGNACGTGHKGLNITSLVQTYSATKKTRANSLSESCKIGCLSGEHIHQQHPNHFYAKAQNLNIRLTSEYNAALSKVSVLAMPTLPSGAPLLPVGDELSDFKVMYKKTGINICNTCPYDATGHPALTVPCGRFDDNNIPIGIQFVGKKFDEAMIYRVANAYEKAALEKADKK